MTTHAGILAWRITWTEELGGLQSMGHKESDVTKQLTEHIVCMHYIYFTYIYIYICIIISYVFLPKCMLPKDSNFCQFCTTSMF